MTPVGPGGGLAGVTAGISGDPSRKSGSRVSYPSNFFRARCEGRSCQLSEYIAGKVATAGVVVIA
jgi:hypothetical protein